MKRLETIHVRLANADRNSLVEDIRKSVALETDIGSVRFYRHVTVATDFSIHIYLETNGVKTEDDSLGSRLAAALREYGMVEHFLWTEEKTNEKNEVLKTIPNNKVYLKPIMNRRREQESPCHPQGSAVK